MIRFDTVFDKEYYEIIRKHDISYLIDIIFTVWMWIIVVLNIIVSIAFKEPAVLFKASSIVILVIAVLDTRIVIVKNPSVAAKRAAKLAPGATNVWSFGEDNFSCCYSSDTQKQNVEYSYENVVSAKESIGYFVIKIKGVGKAFLLVRDITMGSETELRTLLQNKLGNKFKVKSYEFS